MIIEVKNVAFGYDAKKNVFEDKYFSVEKGEILSILGPNGCGKTTLLKCLNGLFQIKRGEINIEGKNINSLKRNEIGKKIGYVPQKQDWTFPYTVMEMVLMGRAPHINVFYSPSSKDIKIAEEAIDNLGISYLANRLYPNISGGEAQLVMIARALTSEPVALLLDEPTSHLDFKNQKVILNVLNKLSKDKNITVVMTTHFPDHALSISDKALLMGNGKYGVVGNAQDVITENNLKDLFEIDVRIISFEVENNNLKTVVPL
ncbi:MAG: ABC transporter ATP-binding protein [Proteobacteria bacterium]|nr:ABC transporter ATP-binding protein [Pseudomonadota bacterium]